MELAAINSREDLDAIAGTPDHTAFMALLQGTLWRLQKDDTAGVWVAVEDSSTIMRFGFTRADFADTPPPDLPVYVPPPPVVIPAVSPRQIRQALTRAGLRTSVEAAVAAGDQDLKDWWEFSTTFERLNPQVTAMGAALGVSDTQLDDLWTLASTL